MESPGCFSAERVSFLVLHEPQRPVSGALEACWLPMVTISVVLARSLGPREGLHARSKPFIHLWTLKKLTQTLGSSSFNVLWLIPDFTLRVSSTS